MSKTIHLHLFYLFVNCSIYKTKAARTFMSVVIQQKCTSRVHIQNFSKLFSLKQSKIVSKDFIPVVIPPPSLLW